MLADCLTLYDIWGVKVSVLREHFISSLIVDKARDRRTSFNIGLIPSLPFFNLLDYTTCLGRSNPRILEFWKFSLEETSSPPPPFFFCNGSDLPVVSLEGSILVQMRCV